MREEIILDVSQLEPCEPLYQILSAIPQLKLGQYLKVLHRMEPQPLYQILEQRGYVWLSQPGKRSPVELFIWHKDDNQVKQLIESVRYLP